MKDKMTSHKVYAVWEYEREIADLNKLSIEGWQLEKGGCFHSTFVRNEDVRYVYQLDYAPKLEDKEMYLSFFEEQGWEYMNSTFNGWHYFRKKYSDGMTKEEMEIYSDKESLEEMQKRYERIMWLCAIVLTLNVIMQGGHVVSGRAGLAQSMLLMIYGLGAAVFWFMLWSQKRKQSGKESTFTIRYDIVLVVWLILFLLTLLILFI